MKIQTGAVLRYVDVTGHLQAFVVDFEDSRMILPEPMIVGMDYKNCFVRIPKSKCLILRRVRRFVTEKIVEDALVPLDLSVSSGVTKLLREAA